jgi:hypothetical protein
MFTQQESATAYAVAAQHMLGDDTSFLENNAAVIPIFVSMLFQSLEISIKSAGVESGLFSMKEARSPQDTRSGHGIKELASLAEEKLGGDNFNAIILALSFSNGQDRVAEFLHEMICGSALEKTRDSYASRRLGYGEVHKGDFALIYPVSEWVSAVKQTAMNLPTTIHILSQWRVSES